MSLNLDSASLNNTFSRVALHTLGCKLNFSETSTLSSLLKQEGFEVVDFENIADIYILNTCSVTENADKECQALVRKVKRLNATCKIVITGCYAQLKPQAIAQIPGVNLVLGAAEKFNLIYYLKLLYDTQTNMVHCSDIQDLNHFQTAFSQENRTRAFLKVQDGCDYNCSFCTIPLARGKSRSDTIEHVIDTIKKLEQDGFQEVILTGINLGDFSTTTNNNKTAYLVDLLLEIEIQTQIPRIRLSSIEPNLLETPIIQLVKDSQKFMPHFHLPLQSGSSAILKKMQRRYHIDFYAKKISEIYSLIPDCGLGIDVIVGFPGETEAYFDETYQFLHGLPFSYLHVFTYSERKNTKAMTMENKVPMSIRKSRNQILRNLSLKKSHFFYKKFVGTYRPTLFEKPLENGTISGYTDNYIRINTPCSDGLENAIVPFKIMPVLTPQQEIVSL